MLAGKDSDSCLGRLTRELSAVEGAAIAEPLSDEESPAQHPLQQTRESATVSRLGQLTGVHRDGRSELTYCDSADEATDDEHSHVNSTCLKRTAQDGDDRSYEDSPATA